MNFSPGPAATQAYMCVDLTILREMLRLPKDVIITAVRQHPTDSHSCILDLQGPLPAAGELSAHYSFVHTTIPEFRGFLQVPRD